MKQKSIKLNMFLNLVKTLLSFMFPLITFPYASRVLGPEGIGKVNFCQSVIGYFAIIASFGIGTYAIREVSKVRDDRKALSIISLEILSVNLITTLIAYICFFFFVFFVPSLYDYRVLLFICSLNLMLTTIGMDWLYVANEDYLYITIRSIIVRIICLLLLFMLVRHKSDYVNYAILIILSSVGSNIWNLLYSRKYISWKYITDLHSLRHFRHLGVFFVTALAASLHTILDQSMLGFLAGDREVGIYVTAVKISDIATAVICAATAILFPRLSYLFKNGENGEWQNLFYKAIDFLLLLTIPCVASLTLLGKATIHIIAGSQFSQSVSVLYVMNFMIIMVVFTNIIGNQLFMAINKERWVLISVAIGVVSNMMLNFILIPQLAAKGAAIASVLSEGIVLLVQIKLLWSILKLNKFWKNIMVYTMNSFILALIIYAITCSVEDYFAQMTLSIIIGSFSYFLILIMQRNTLAISIFQYISIKLKNG